MQAKGHSRQWNALLAVLYVALLLVGFVPFQYAIDPDGTSYLTLAKRWAAGDFTRAVNGYWSPWSVWLTAGGIKLGWNERVAAIAQFAIGGGFFLALTMGHIRRQAMALVVQRTIEICLVVFTVYAVYLQWFNDLWAAAFGIWAVQILGTASSKKHFQNAFLYGVAIALAYYSKVYFLPFLVLLTTVWLFKKGGISFFKKLLFAGIAALVAFCLCAPWWVALHGKYGFWTTGTAGPLNLSWGLLGHPVFAKGTILLYPTYPGSPSYWEDPWWSNATTVHFWDSPQLALQQIIRSSYFSSRLLWKAFLITPLVPAAGVFCGINLIRSRLKKTAFKTSFETAAPLLLFPLGMLLVHSESRYLWFLIPFAFMWLAGQQEGIFLRFKKELLLLGGIGLLLSPALDISHMWYAGRAEKEFAKALKRKGVSSGFTTAKGEGPTYAQCLRLAYFSGVPYLPAAGLVLPLQQAVIIAPEAGAPYLFISANSPLPAGAVAVHKAGKWQFIMLPVKYSERLFLNTPATY